MAVRAAHHPHMAPVSGGTIVFFVIFTVGWFVAVASVRNFWNVPATFPSFSPQAVPIQRNFRRQGPSALIAGAFLIALGWTFTLFPNAGWAVVPILLFALLLLVAVAVLASVWLFNRPRRLVPPNLRDGPGLWSNPT
jgi:hypothetical protein